MNWIANKDECLKPENGEDVLVTLVKNYGATMRTKGLSFATYLDGRFMQDQGEGSTVDRTENTIGWMRLPEPMDLDDGYSGN